MLVLIENLIVVGYRNRNKYALNGNIKTTNNRIENLMVVVSVVTETEVKYPLNGNNKTSHIIDRAKVESGSIAYFVCY